MRIVICISLIGMMLLGGLAFGTVTKATHTATKKMNGDPQGPYGTPQISLNASGDEVPFIQNRTTIMTGASQSASSIRHWHLTTLPADPNMPFPPYLVGGDMVRLDNENRGLKDYQLTIQTDCPSYVYLVMENRVNGTSTQADPNGDPNDVLSMYSDPKLDESPSSIISNWVAADGWVRVNTGNNHTAQEPAAPDFVGNDEGPDGKLDQYAAVYRKVTEPNELDPTNHLITLGAQGLGNMYGVIVKPAPSPADLTKDGTVDIDDMIDFAGQWLNGTGGSSNNLAHRYTFDEGAGTTIHDVVGGANGTLVDLDDTVTPGTQTFSAWGTGYLDLLNLDNTQRDTLARGGAYIQLPSGMIDALRNDNGITFEIFYQKPTSGPDDNWRSSYFCFGAGNPNGGTNDQFTLLSRNNDNHVVYWHQQAGYWDQWKEKAPKMAGHTHVAVVVDTALTDPNNHIRVYVDGALKHDHSINTWEMPGFKLGDGTYNDTVNYLGRGYTTGPDANTMARVRYKAFNIYGRALTASQVQTSFNTGPDKVCTDNYAADLDRDCDVDLQDFEILASAWLLSI